MKILYIDRGITAEPSEKWTWLPPETDVFLTAETVSDAREIILRELPDLIVSEVELPDGSGIGNLLLRVAAAAKEGKGREGRENVSGSFHIPGSGTHKVRATRQS